MERAISLNLNVKVGDWIKVVSDNDIRIGKVSLLRDFGLNGIFLHYQVGVRHYIARTFTLEQLSGVVVVDDSEVAQEWTTLYSEVVRLRTAHPGS